jgi:hypothetical protein
MDTWYKILFGLAAVIYLIGAIIIFVIEVLYYMVW